MLEGKNILSFAMDYWDGQWMSRHQVLSRLSRKNKILFVSPPFYLRDVLHHFKKSSLHPSGTIKVNENLWAHVPSKLFPYNYKFKQIDRICGYFRKIAIFRLMRRLKMKDPILLIWNPDFINEVGKYGEKLVIFYVHDMYADFTICPKEREAIIKKEDSLLKMTDIVIATSEKLHDRLARKHKFVIYSPNGVDFELFQQALKKPKHLSDLEKIPRPRIGYVGAINKKVDIYLLYHLATKYPKWSIVMVGPERALGKKEDALKKKLKDLNNVFFLGFKPSVDIPYYIEGLDICLICYKMGGWVPYIYPLKLHEYLACGKPTVGSSIDSLIKFRHIIGIADTPEEWEFEIKAGLAENDSFLVERRIRIARENSWDARIEKISKAIQRYIDSVHP